MNMDVKSVMKSAPGLARKRPGTKAHLLMNASPPDSSTKKNRALMAIRAYVTIGTVLRELSSSPSGNIPLILLLLSFWMSCEVLSREALPDLGGDLPVGHLVGRLNGEDVFLESRALKPLLQFALGFAGPKDLNHLGIS